MLTYGQKLGYLVLGCLVVSLTIACSSDGGRCEKAVQHIMLGLIPTDAPGQPGAGERAIIEVVAKAGIAQCKGEGLSQAQADCILAVKGVEPSDWRKLGECPAIAARKPSWLIIPSPDMLDLMEKAAEERERRDSAPDAE
jgi:hypothetical protein